MVAVIVGGPGCRRVSTDHRHGKTTKIRGGQACEKVGQTRNVDLYGYGGYTYVVRARPGCTTEPRDDTPMVGVPIKRGINKVTFTS